MILSPIPLGPGVGFDFTRPTPSVPFVAGIEAALSGAKASAGDKDVSVMGGEHIELETVEAIETAAIHLRFRVVK